MLVWCWSFPMEVLAPNFLAVVASSVFGLRWIWCFFFKQRAASAWWCSINTSKKIRTRDTWAPFGLETDISMIRYFHTFLWSWNPSLHYTYEHPFTTKSRNCTDHSDWLMRQTESSHVQWTIKLIGIKSEYQLSNSQFSLFVRPTFPWRISQVPSTPKHFGSRPLDLFFIRRTPKAQWKSQASTSSFHLAIYELVLLGKSTSRFSPSIGGSSKKLSLKQSIETCDLVFRISEITWDQFGEHPTLLETNLFLDSS